MSRARPPRDAVSTHDEVDTAEVAIALRARFKRDMTWTLASIPPALVVLGAIMWRHVDQRTLLVWVGLGLATLFVHLGLWYRHPPEVDWTTRAYGAMAFSGAFWGLTPWLLMPEDPLWAVLLATSIVTALGASAVFGSMLKRSMVCFAGPLVVPGALGYLALAEGDAKWAAATIVGAAAFNIILAIAHRSSAVEAIVLSVRSYALATEDALTGAASRREILATLDEWAAESPDTTGLAYLDIDEFKAVNDEFGHAAGDSVLAETVRRLGSVLRPDEVIGRMGGDEFVVVSRRLIGHAEAAELAQRLLSRFSQPFRFDDVVLQLSISIGVAVPSAGISPALLIAEADHAMYLAKRSSSERAMTTVGDLRDHRAVS